MHQCHTCKREFARPQSLGLHLWHNRRRRTTCVDRRTPQEKYLDQTLLNRAGLKADFKKFC